MQTLKYEASWKKAISEKDRHEIEAIFSNLNTYPPFNVIRHAVNHKGELLVTAIVHNTTDRPLLFLDEVITYSIDGKLIAENIFKISSFIVPPMTSMPWTFIYPVGNWKGELEKFGELQFA